MSYPDYFYYDDGSGYPYDEFEYDEDNEYYADEADYFCEEENCTMEVLDQCQCCGKALCHMHSEIGRGFLS